MTKSPLIAVVCIGDELLDGRIHEQNGIALMRHLRAEHGLRVTLLTICSDLPEQIESILHQASLHHDLVVVSGGLGPTEDDRTRYAIAQVAGVPLIHDEDAWERIKARFATRGRTPTKNNVKQAMFPESATILPSDVGTASGFWVALNRAIVLSTPGVPREFEWFVQTYVPPLLEHLGHTSAKKFTQRMRFFGIGESALEHRLEGLGAFGKELTVGYRAAFPELEVSLGATDKALLEQAEQLIQSKAGEWFTVRGEEDLLDAVTKRLKGEGLTVTCAESCTGGLLGAALTQLSGASAWFERGYLTYANEAKHDLLGVEQAMLREHGAVSREVVLQMADGARWRAGSDFALAISGIAGPTGGSEEKPVGLVHFALSSEEGTWHTMRIWKGMSRERVREGAVYMALLFLLWRLDGRLETAAGVSGPFTQAEIWPSHKGLDLQP